MESSNIIEEKLKVVVYHHYEYKIVKMYRATQISVKT